MDQETTVVQPAQAAGDHAHFRNQANPGRAGIKRRVPDLAFELVVYCSVCSVLLSCLYYVDQLVG